MKRAGIVDANLFAELVEQDRPGLDDLSSELERGRDLLRAQSRAIRLVRRNVLPGVRRHCSTEQTVRVWSGGRASTAERYSLAMMLKEKGRHRSPPFSLACALRREGDPFGRTMHVQMSSHRREGAGDAADEAEASS